MSVALEAQRLSELEAVIERGMHTFIEIGNALMEIRDAELYRESGFSGFVEYLESKPWGIGLNYAEKQMAAAKVAAICTNVQTEGQARELAPLMRQAAPEVVKQVYAEVVEDTDGKPTASAIREKVQDILHPNGGKPTRKRSKVDDDLEQYLSEIKKLIPRWESRFVDSCSGKNGRRRVQLAEDIAEWLTGTYVPAHAALVTPLAKIPT